MNEQLSLQQKWWFCFTAVLALYLSGIYVLNPVGLGLLGWDNLALWLGKFLLNVLFAFFWFLLLEQGLAQMKKALTLSGWKNQLLSYYMLGGVGIFIACLGVVWLLQPLRHWFWTFDTHSPDLNTFATRAVFGMVACIVVCGFLALTNRQIWLSMENIRFRADLMEKENLESKIIALNNQVNPHFLFNSLSILSSLVRRDADKSEQFILQLSKAYHYILERRESDTVPLEDELTFLEAYAFLLKTRFEGKFEVRVNIDPALRSHARIAPLTLQLLVENAVKHNRMSEKEPLVIQITAENGLLQVRNRIRERGEPQNSMGMGLQNITNRYALLSRQPVQAGEREGDFVVETPLL